ncbi:MAG: DUF4249 domain-containing protein [Bacteroidetes bacterium]|nr:DUF4249 domain-containing protein [Bacteroidota bacterium]
MKKLICKILFPGVLTFSLASCIEQIRVPVRTETPILVVDGTITNQAGPYQVRLSQTGTFNLPSEAYDKLAVRGAAIQIEEKETGQIVPLVETSGAGVYQTRDPDFVGKTGNTYVIQIKTRDGKTYRSDPEVMPASPPIKELSANYTDNEGIVNDTPFGYNISLETDDPADQTNYYRWTAYSYIRRQSVGVLTFGGNYWYQYCWTPVTESTVVIQSDVYSNGRPLREQVFRSPIYIVGKHFVEVTQYALTREAYQFWRRFNEQRQRVGTIFDPLPSPIIGNVYNADNPNDRALGYFTASGVSTKRIIIPGDTLTQSHLDIETRRFIAPGDCRRAFYKGTEERPEGWE